MLIEDFILQGRNNGISQADLSRITSLPERIVRREIDEARIKRGKLIIGDESGYWFPTEQSEIAGYVNRRKASINTSRKALRPFIQALRR